MFERRIRKYFTIHFQFPFLYQSKYIFILFFIRNDCMMYAHAPVNEFFFRVLTAIWKRNRNHHDYHIVDVLMMIYACSILQNRWLNRANVLFLLDSFLTYDQWPEYLRLNLRKMGDLNDLWMIFGWNCLICRIASHGFDMWFNCMTELNAQKSRATPNTIDVNEHSFESRMYECFYSSIFLSCSSMTQCAAFEVISIPKSEIDSICSLDFATLNVLINSNAFYIQNS